MPNSVQEELRHPWDSESQSIRNILPPLAVNGKTPIITCPDWMPRLVNCGLYVKGRKRTQERTNVGKHDKSQRKTVVCWVKQENLQNSKPRPHQNVFLAVVSNCDKLNNGSPNTPHPCSWNLQCYLVLQKGLRKYDQVKKVSQGGY